MLKNKFYSSKSTTYKRLPQDPEISLLGPICGMQITGDMPSTCPWNLRNVMPVAKNGWRFTRPFSIQAGLTCQQLVASLASTVSDRALLTMPSLTARINKHCNR
ncbi:hypothetical protein J6590_021112 [Homalodisca vitripennis]|nr:hypothetical protein J6590_021112 [Homalodisca vitripennis]